MFKNKGEVLVDVFAVGLTSLLFLAVWGRAINSQAAFRLSPVPLIGPVVDSLRAVTNQAYDVAGED